MLLFLAVLSGCQRQIAPVIPVPPVVVKPLLVPDDPSHPVFKTLKSGSQVFDFYTLHASQPVWYHQPALQDSLRAFLQKARLHGLLPQHYHAATVLNIRSRPTDTLGMLREEVLFTDAFLSLRRDLRYGRLTSQSDTSGVRALSLAFETGNISDQLSSAAPAADGYRQLQQYLASLILQQKELVQRVLRRGDLCDSSALDQQIQLIEINLDRWRHADVLPKGRYVWVNIPTYEVEVIDNGKSTFTSRAIVGAVESPTPRFSSVIECLTLFPYWHVPRKIAVNDYLPALKTDTTFLQRNNFEVLDKKGILVDAATIDWSKYNEKNFPFTLRQREGEENALGVIKFVFDNPYAVFLHDTNAPRHFQKKKRALSHGCIRVEKAVELAQMLAGPRTDIKAKLALRQRAWIQVKNIPVHLRYFTCEVRDNTFRTYEDVYDLDRALYAVYGQLVSF